MKKIKLFFLRNKDRFFRFLTLFMSCFVLSFSVFSFNSYANPSNYVYYTSFAQPQVTANSCYLEVITSNGWKFFIQCVAYGLLDSQSVSPRFKATVMNNQICISVTSSQFHIDPSSNVAVGVYGAYTDVVHNSTGPLGTLSDSSVQPYGFFATYSLSNSGSVSKIHGYNCDTSSITRDGDFTFVYGSDTVLNQKMDIINNTLSSIDSNTDLTVDRLYDLISHIITTNSKLNQINSTIKSEGVLTREKIDKVIEYLEAAENGAYYNPSDDGTSSTVNNQQQKDEQVMQGTSTGRTEANNAISGFSGLLTTTGAVFKGSTAMTKVFNLFAQSSYLVPILQISLVLGISSFVLGTAFIVVGRIRNKKE